jgi:hypothetical protein
MYVALVCQKITSSQGQGQVVELSSVLCKNDIILQQQILMLLLPETN